MIHKGEVNVGIKDWPTDVSSYFRNVDCDYHIYCVATEEELKRDVEWCRARSESLANMPEGTHVPSGAENLPPGTTDTDHFKALIPTEQDRCCGYWNKLGGLRSDTVAAGLGQEPLGKPYHNNGKRYLQALIRNSHIVWDFHFMRYLAPPELMLAQGFPRPGLSTAKSSFSVERPESVPPRQRQHVTKALGNCMNCHVIQTAVTWAAPLLKAPTSSSSSSSTSTSSSAGASSSTTPTPATSDTSGAAGQLQPQGAMATLLARAKAWKK